MCKKATEKLCIFCRRLFVGLGLSIQWRQRFADPHEVYQLAFFDKGDEKVEVLYKAQVALIRLLRIGCKYSPSMVGAICSSQALYKHIVYWYTQLVAFKNAHTDLSYLIYLHRVRIFGVHFCEVFTVTNTKRVARR